MSIVSIINNEIKLCSGMSEAAFGKTNYASIITQAGTFFDGESFNNWTFNDVRAEETDSSSERQVYYCGQNPLSENAKTLLSIFEDGEKSDSTAQEKEFKFQAGLAVCEILTKAALENVELPKIGAGGIFVDLSAEKIKVLFLPVGLYEGSVAGLAESEYARQQGFWINTSIFDLPSICFQRSVIAYRMLTSNLPYFHCNLQERNADIYDKNFLPVELCISGIDSTLASAINKGLKLNSNVLEALKTKKKRKHSEDLTPSPDFPIEALKNSRTIVNDSQISNSELNQKAEAFLKLQKSKVKTKRAIRRNVTRILVCVILVAIFSILTANVISSNGKNLTSTGLTSVQTIEAFFQGINNKDSSLLDNISNGKTPKRMVNTISRIYVVGKQRKTYGHDNGFASPENWILYLKDESFLASTGLYGVTNVRIDGKLSSLDTELHMRKEKISPLEKENGITLENNMTSIHQVEYYHLHSEGDANDLFIEYITETYTLTFEKNRWIITDIQTDSKPVDIDSSLFFYEYFNLLRRNEGDTIKTVQMLSLSCPWLPQISLIKKEQKRLEEIAADPFRFE